MKLQIAFDTTNLSQALTIAAAVAPHADILEVGTLLLFMHGTQAVKAFRESFPHHPLFVDAKVIDRGKSVVEIMTAAGATHISVMAGTHKQVIHTACITAQEKRAHVALDLLDAESLGQSALDAKNLGAHSLVLHEPYDKAESSGLMDKWDMIKDNSPLPVFVSAKITRNSIDSILALNPHGIIIGSSITEAANPAAEAAYFKELITDR